MKRTKKLLSFLLAVVLVFGCLPGTAFAATGVKPEDGTTKRQPFASGTGGSTNFRIPGLVSLDNGTIVGSCDARWNTAGDGGGLDTIVSHSTDNGATWNYTFANYLGDNGNVWNGASTAFIDPALATDGKTVYMIADLYPASYALNSANNSPTPGVSMDEDGNLLLSADNRSTYAYHLEKKSNATTASYYEIKDADGSVVEDYTVDAYFNIKGNNVDTNLFCADSPYLTFPTDYLYFTTSEDGGATWSVPTLLNMRKSAEQSLLVGPGRGLVTSTGRIIFTVYEFTYRDKNSACIYSDDGGKTWTRGASVSSQSSEATVVEADGKLYMFTRHGGYYVSDNWGETWSDRIEPGISYNLGCQLSAITYSQKIDGKTAIILSAPSNTGSRAAGKFFVGLVQADGSIDWAYEYSVNGSDYYAYSCLTELIDGSIGLLYESGGAAITYTNIPISDIVEDAAIGNLWLEDADNNVTTTTVIKPDTSATFTVCGVSEGEIQAVSADETVATVSVSGNTITVSASSSVSGLGQTVITVKVGTEEIRLSVNVTSEENYEIVTLRMGDSKKYVDNTGNYSDADLSGANTDIAGVTISGESRESELQAQLATGVGTFTGKKVDLSDCLYTFTKSSDNTYTMSASTADGTTVYLSHSNSSSATIPNTTTAITITVAKNSAEDSFSLQGNSGGGGKFLYFHKSGNLYFNRQSSADANCYFELYTPSESAPADSLIKGYTKITSLDEIADGGKYLIVSLGADNNYYALYPSVSGSNFNHVAKVTDEYSVIEEPAVQLATAVATFNGELTGVSNCLYTFTATGDNTYQITSTTADGSMVYVYYKNNTSNIPNSSTSTTITLAENPEDSSKFSLYDNASGSTGGYLYFWKTAGSNGQNLYYDRNSSVVDNCYFELYAPTETASSDSPVAGYEKVGSLADIEDGGQYLIASQAGDSYYLLHPALAGNNYDHVAKVTDETINYSTGSTEIVIDGKTEGSTSVKIGDTTYFIIVKNDEENITLKIGESFVAPGTVMQQDANQNVVTTEANTTFAPYARITDFVPDEKYLIVQGNYIMINSPSTASGSPAGLDMKAVDLTYDELSEYMWTISSVDGGGYTIQDADGKYLNFTDQSGSQASIVLSDTAQTLSIGNGSSDGFGISYNNYYMNNWSKSYNRVAGYSSNDNNWYFYQAAEGLVITGANAGTTSIIISGTTYNITVIEDSAGADYSAVDAAIAAANALNKENYKDFSAVETAINNVVRGKDTTEQAAVDAMAKAINDAVAALELKDADYTAVDAAIAAANALNKEDYKDFSAVEDAINAVVRGKDITKQAEVDAMAKAINDAVAGLEEVDPVIDPTPSPELPYKDVNKGDWFYDYVYDVYEKELMTGLEETVFAPNNNIVRAQFAVILYRMAGSPDVTFKNTFADVSDGQFYSKAVTWAAENGIVTGYTGSGLFGPNDQITREQMAAMMFRYANYTKHRDTSARKNLDSFPDGNKVQEFAVDAVKWCVAEGIISGKGEEPKILDPQGSTVRAEAATIISRYTKPVIITPDVINEMN